MTAYDELATFQFKPGKAYDKRSVEEFRAAALTALDDALRATTLLEDQLAGGTSRRHEASASDTPVLSLEEQRLLEQFRGMDSYSRLSVLESIIKPTAPAGNSFGAAVASWEEPPGWSEPALVAPATEREPFAGQSFESWDATQNLSAPNPFETPNVAIPQHPNLASSYAQPDWLDDWDAVAPTDPTNTFEPPTYDWNVVAPTEPAPAIEQPIHDWDKVAATEPTPAFGQPAYDWDVPAPAASSFAPPLPMPSVHRPDPSSEWGNEVDVPVKAEVIQHPDATTFSSMALNDEHLEVLFSQLDFGPPSVDLLSNTESTGHLHTSSPLRVVQAQTDAEFLPPAVRPWEGWIQ